MKIREVTIEGETGIEIVIRKTGSGAIVTDGKIVVANFSRFDEQPALREKVQPVAKAVYGTDRTGKVAATNSMVGDLLDLVTRVIDC